MAINKTFVERLHRMLDGISMPKNLEERAEKFGSMFGLPRYTSSFILNGHLLPGTRILSRIAEDLEVESEWLLGD